MLLLKPEDLKVFLQCKVEEIEVIIQKNITKSPAVIAQMIVKELNYNNLPFSLLQSAKTPIINKHKKKFVGVNPIPKKKGGELNEENA